MGGRAWRWLPGAPGHAVAAGAIGLGATGVAAPALAQIPEVEAAVAGEALPSACAANALFVVAALLDRPAPYSRCLGLVPPRAGGNSMLELRDALVHLGFDARARRVRPEQLAPLDAVCIVWTPGQGEVRTPGGGRYRVGHFVVARPLGGGRWQILDFPTKRQIVDGPRWARESVPDADQSGIPVLVVRAGDGPASRAEGEDGTSGQTGIGPAEPGGDPGDAGEVLSASVAAGFVASPAPAPRARADVHIGEDSPGVVTGQIDFGDALEGETLAGVVSVRNDRTESLRLTGVEATCGCTTGPLSRDVLGPGEVADLDVALDLRGRTGQVAEMVTIEGTTESRDVRVAIRVVASARPLWHVEPAWLSFGAVAEDGEPLVRTALVRAGVPGRAAELDSVSVSREALTGRLETIDAGLRRYRLVVCLDPRRAGRGVLATGVRLSSRGGQGAEVTVPVTAEITGVLDIEPARIVLTPGGDSSVTVRAGHASGGPVRFVGARTLHGEIPLASVDELPAAAGGGAGGLALRLVLVPPSRRAMDEVELTVRCPDGLERVVAVPVMVMVPDR